MIGKTYICLLSIVLVLFAPTRSVAALPTTDVTSYTYYAQQIEQFAEQINHAIAAVEELGNIKGLTDEVLGSVKGAYDFGTGVLRDVKKIRKKLDMEAWSIQREAQKWIDIAEDPEFKDITDIAVILGEVFNDRRDENSTIYKTLDEVYQLRQGALNAVIDEAQVILDEWEQTIERINSYAERADATNDLGQAQALTNVILTEVLFCLEKMRRFDAQYSQSLALLEFKGISDEIYSKSSEKKNRHFGPSDSALDSSDPDWSIKDISRITLGEE